MAEKNKKNQLIVLGKIPLIGVLAAFLVAMLLSLFATQASNNSDHRQVLINRAADNVQVRINQAQLQLLKQANNIATSIRLTELVSNADAAARSLEESRLREMIPNAVRVRMFKIGEAQVERDNNPPFTFTSLDLVNRAEQGEAVFPEAINANGRWLISLAAPIKPPSSDTIRGTLFIYLDITALGDYLNEGLHGEVSINQSFHNNPEVAFLTLGQGGNDNGPVLERALMSQHWTLKFKPDSELTNATVGSTALAAVPALASLLITLGALFAGLRMIIRTVKEDTTLFQNQMADVINDRFKPNTSYRFTEFMELDLLLARMGKRAAKKQAVAPLNVKAKTKAVEREEEDEDEFEFEDSAEFELDETDEAPVENEVVAKSANISDETDVSSIFRAYDIRGIVGETLTQDIIYRIGLAIGTEAELIGEQTLLVGADGRLSSPDLVDALIQGLRKSGRDVINIGFVPTPLLYFATHNSDTSSGVMVTGSHNAANYNGLKIVFDGRTLVDEDIQRLYETYQSGEFSEGEGELTEIDIRDDYMDAITDDVVVAQPLRVAVDCGNGIAGDIVPELLANLGCEVIPLYCEVDGNFPNHHPDPIVPENLEDLIITVKSQEADIGLAFDGDGDRLVAVTAEGEIVWPDRLLMLFAKDVVSRNPGSDVVYDVKCTRHLNSVISGFGGRPVISRSGHSFVKAKMAETDAMLGGEMSGHICFKERWFGFDDGMYSAARLLEIVGSQAEGLTELLEEFPASVATPEIIIPVAESAKFNIIEELLANADFGDATVSTVDGIRVDFAEGWGLVRASNTSPCLTLRFEADNLRTLNEIQTTFKKHLSAVDEKLTF